MDAMTQPAVRPANPCFSSGPCAKRPGWSPENLRDALLGRSHRSKPGKARLEEAIARTRAVLGVPDDYRIGIVPASDTGAVEMALWSLLGARGWKWPTDAEAPPEVQNLKAEVLVANDPLARWLDEFEVTYDPTRWTAKADIYAHYDAVMKGRAQSQRDRDRILSYDHFWKEMSMPERRFHLEKRMRKGTGRVDAAHIVVTGVTARAEK